MNSANEDSLIKNCRAVCLALGPYRNLTTLTAATLFLHPNCQVLNHAGARVFDSEHNFLSEFTQKRLDNFVRFSTEISEDGKRGSYGGSITHSHAFDDKYNIKKLFDSTGQKMVKEKIQGIFWKESHKTLNLIKDKNIDLDAMFAADSRPRFLMPIRNPLDCAKSNLKTGHVRNFRGLSESSSITEVSNAFLDEILWFVTRQSKHPGRFFCYFENAITHEMLTGLEAFMELDHQENWITLAQEAMQTKAHYNYDKSVVTDYRNAVARRFEAFPEVSRQLLAFFPE